jgi:hypothetical protein
MNAATVRRDAAATADEREPLKMERRIGSTLYTINVYANPNAAETAEQIILRLIEREVTR